MNNIKPFPSLDVIDLKDKLVKRGDHVTHGDLIIVRCEEKDLPMNFQSLNDCPDGILALGEFTGHAHKLEVDSEPLPTTPSPTLSVISNNLKPLSERVISKMVGPEEIYIKVLEPVLLKHQEHKFFRLYPGDYEIGIQVERNPYDDMVRALRD